MAGSIGRYFGGVDDPRQDQGKRHSLESIIAITIIGVICGADDWQEVADVARAKEPWLRTFLDLPHGPPSHDTLGRVFSLIDPRAFERGLVAWLGHVCSLPHRQLVRIDGKTIRRSYGASGGTPGGEGRAPLHMVSAWCTANSVVLGQLATDFKENEITAIPRLLELLDLRGAVVTIDAIGCQKSIANQIIEAGGDYVLQVKANQPTLLADLELFFEDAIEQGLEGTPHAKAAAGPEKDHGRIEERTLWAMWEVGWLGRSRRDGHWPSLRSVWCVEARVEQEGGLSRERRYYISSLDPREEAGGAGFLLELARGHWGIESVHWSLDLAFREDESRVRLGHAQENLAAVRRATLGLLKQETHFKAGIKRKRRRCAMDQDYLNQVLSG